MTELTALLERAIAGWVASVEVRNFERAERFAVLAFTIESERRACPNPGTTSSAGRREKGS
jgi:hypothetical protein